MATSYSGVWNTPNSYYEVSASPETGRAGMVARRTEESSSDAYAVVGNKPLTPGAVNRFGVKLNAHRYRNRLYVGVAPYGTNFSDENLMDRAGWYMDTRSRELYSGPPFNYDGKSYDRGPYVCKNEVVGVIADLAANPPTITFAVDGHTLDVAYKGFPTDKPLFPVVITGDEDSEVELLPNDQLYVARSLANSDGDYVFLGSQDDDCGGIIYCGLKKHQCRCHGCDGTCGPNNGCACNACDALLDDLVAAAQEHLKCTKDHMLKKVVLGKGLSPAYRGGYSCDECENSISRNGRVFFHCEECSYDLCPNCMIKKIPKDLLKKGAFPITKKV